MLYLPLLLLGSCYSELDLEIPEHESKVVVEGWIEPGKSPEIILTQTAPYFAQIDSSNIKDFALSKAVVQVITDSTSEKLIYRPYKIYFPPYIYFGLDIKGEVGESYILEIIYQKKIIRAETSIPEPVEPDSVWIYKLTDSDTLGMLRIRIYDEPDVKNYYRTLVKRKRKDTKFIPTLVSVFDDSYFNGDTITINLSQGLETLLEAGKQRYFNLEDTIILKFCTMDKSSYNFWNAISIKVLSAANQFSPSNTHIDGNIDGGIGIWAGYGVVYDTVYYKP